MLWLTALLLTAQPFEGGFPLVVPATATAPSLLDIGFLNDTPADQLGPVTLRDGHCYDRQGRRLRFLGTNVTFAGAFPPAELAPQIARRFRQLGINVVRFHHIDNATAPRGLWADAQQTALDPAQLDKLDRFAAELLQQGIFLNLNLHVSRNYAGVDFAAIPYAFRYGKVIDYFHPRLIEQQRQYASLLLTHVNPYTKRRWADEPGMLVCELNNENTLLGAAFSSDLLALPPDLLQPLLTGWGAWLRERYGTSAKCRAAWQAGGEPLGAELVADGRFDRGAERWILESPAPAEATMQVLPTAGPAGGPALRAVQTKPGTRAWDFQVHRRGLSLTAERTYTLSFAGRADPARSISLGVRLQEPDWRMLGLNSSANLTATWSRHTLVFSATETVAEKVRLSFNLGNSPGAVELAEVSLRPGSGLDLPADARFEDLPAPIRSGLKEQRVDWVRYLLEVERRYVATLTRHLRETIGLRAPIICTQGSYGGIGGIQREVDGCSFVDMHSYWQHPSFPGKPWDPANWSIGNTPLVESASGGTLSRLAMHRVAGRAFTVSEYNHPAPNFYRAEMFPLVAAMAALQDWDGVYQFTFASSDDHYRAEKLTGYFNLAGDPAHLATAPFAALLLRQGLLPPAPREVLLEVGRDRLPALIAAGQAAPEKLWSLAGAEPRLAGEARLGLRLVAGDRAPRLVGEATPAPGPAGWLTPPEAAFRWFAGTPASAQVETPQLLAVVGRIGGRAVTVGPLTVELAAGGRNFATLLLASRDGQPVAQSKQLLLVLLGAVVNQGMEWNETFTSVSNKWGSGPTLAEPLRATITLRTQQALRAQALDGSGAPRGDVPLTRGEALTLRIDPAQQAAIYSLTAP
ncbi:MAG: hypothetical protein IT204_00700 [Fimbriimonadaceae bacterium]|nr:hypothetical protein [Fimbriimonadaceae bacterium]